ncbi:DUF4145 domain-containing protein [Streptomyces sp. NBC_00448]|uniref:DUF4145 domain-containing protein n=1 Tax=Streptomyces sp. NBC_00448 TaxID=2903652 RepID=UPI002E1C20F2
MGVPTTNCGWCGAFAAMEFVQFSVTATGGHAPVPAAPGVRPRLVPTFWEMYTCPACNAASIALVAHEDGEDESVFLRWVPDKPPVRGYPDSVPKAIAGAAAEAHSSLRVGNIQAAVLMARTTVEATAKAKGITSGNLVAKIDALYAQHLIYEHVRDAAHEVRFAGNDAAHGDLVDDPISADEAATIVELMDMLLDGVFIAPAKTAAQTLARQARKNAGSTATTTTPAVSAP